MKKRFLAILLVMVMAISTIGVTAAFAAPSINISGPSEVTAGETYTYSVTVNAYAFNFASLVSCGGVFSGSSVQCNNDATANGDLSATASINVTVSADAKPGDTGSISVKGEGCTIDENFNPTDEFNISDSKTVTVVAKPTATPEPESTPNPTKKPSSNKTESTKPTETPKPSAWQIASDEVDGMKNGGSLTVDLSDEDDDHEIPVEIYNVLREKQGILTLNFGSYSCTLDGTALSELDEDEDELDLGLSFETDEDYSEAVGGKDVYQLHFDHKGEFPGKISFTFKADKNSPGDTVYLYYYYGTSKVIEGIQSAVVDEDGNVTFDIYHCSSYFVSSALIEGAAGIVTQAEPEPTLTPEPTPEPTAEPTPEPTPTPLPNPETGEPTQTNGFPLAVLIAVGIGMALIGVLITMIVCHAGPFKRKSSGRSEY